MVGRMEISRVVACLAWTLAAIGADAPTPTGAIVGRVVDAEGKPVGSAEVWGVARGKAAYEEVGRSRTDADGRFKLASLRVDREVAVYFDAPGMARERHESVHVFEGRDHEIVPMVLVSGTRVAGRVVDAQGRAVPGAKLAVEVYHRVLSHTIDSNQAKWEIVADADGRFQTSSLPSGEAAFTFTATGKVRTRIDRRTQPGTATIELDDVKLEDEIPIRGVIVDKSGQPAPKVEVQADYDYKNTTMTDAQGRFTLGGHGKDAKEVRLTSNAYFAPKPFPIGPDRLNLRFEVIKSFAIKGTAVDAETGAPVNLETVRLCVVVHEPDGTTSLQG